MLVCGALAAYDSHLGFGAHQQRIFVFPFAQHTRRFQLFLQPVKALVEHGVGNTNSRESIPLVVGLVVGEGISTGREVKARISAGTRALFRQDHSPMTLLPCSLQIFSTSPDNPRVPS
jgi:hypothetical protein